MSLVVVGGTVVDMIFAGVKRLPVWPKHTEFTASNLELLERPPLLTLGGNGANAAYVAARRGAQVKLYSTIGDDELGKLALKWLRSAGCRVIAASAGTATASNVTIANRRLERATLFYPGERTGMPDLRKWSLPRGGRKAVLVCGWPHPSLKEIAREFRALGQEGVLTGLDTGPILTKPWTLRALQPVLDHLGVLLTNEFEICAITRSTRLKEASLKLRERYSNDVVIKCGARGVVWLPANTSEHIAIPGRPVRAINSVGAGDGFNGALLAALLRGTPFRDSLEEANEVAARLVASTRGVLGVKQRRRA